MEEIEAACLIDSYGAVDELAAQGLREAGWDVEFLDSLAVGDIRRSLEDDRPVIALLPVGSAGEHLFAHAVVVCGIDAEEVTVMDPAMGAFRTIPLSMLQLFTASGFRGLRIAGTGGQRGMDLE